MSIQVKQTIVAAVGLLSPVMSKGKLSLLISSDLLHGNGAFKTTAQLDAWSKNSPESYNMKM
jgi:hypothetical protein